jgi:polysaccharide export outer membrane protein
MLRRAGLLTQVGLALGLGAAGCVPGGNYGRPLLQPDGWGPPGPAPGMMMAPPPPMMMPPSPFAAIQTPPAAPLPAMPLPAMLPPTEKFKVTHPEYVLEVPDVVKIDIVRALPKGPYTVQPADVLTIQATPSLPDERVGGNYRIGPDGRVTLGMSYGAVIVADLTIDQAEEAVRKHLAMYVQKPKVCVSLAQIGALAQAQGPHLIAPDGTIRLGKFGGVFVAGLTVDEAKAAVEKHLAAHGLTRPEVSLTVQGFNSKFYYVITQGAQGEQVVRLPATGNETVLDAMSQLNMGTTQPHVWIVRPAALSAGTPEQILPVDWTGITRAGITQTNYQLLPGDRLYVVSQPMAWTNTAPEPPHPSEGLKLSKLLPASFSR